MGTPSRLQPNPKPKRVHTTQSKMVDGLPNMLGQQHRRVREEDEVPGICPDDVLRLIPEDLLDTLLYNPNHGPLAWTPNWESLNSHFAPDKNFKLRQKKEKGRAAAQIRGPHLKAQNYGAFVDSSSPASEGRDIVCTTPLATPWGT